MSKIIQIARNVFNTEIEELRSISDRINNAFKDAITLISNSKGRIALLGMGKSGIIGNKISATLASTGTPSFVVHPGEAFHGDLGMIQPLDVILMISNSGETDELIKLIPFLKYQKNSIILMTGNLRSTLAKNADVVIDIQVTKEACVNNLAPTSSTTAALVMGDALAVTLSTLKQFRPEDFAKFHPGGSLGRQLLTKVSDVMQKKDLPICDKNDSFKDVIQQITKGRLGITIVSNHDSQLHGIITDGDIRRTFEKFENPLNLHAADFMTVNPLTIGPNELLTTAEHIMLTKKVNSLIVKGDNEEPIGVVQIYNR